MKTYREPTDAKLDAELAAARARGKAEKPFCARTLRYDAPTDTLHLKLFSGVSVIVPRSMIPGFNRAKPQELRKARLSPQGVAILVNDAIDYSVPGILRLISGVAEQRRLAGSKTSAKKAAAVRANGKKGGRPRKRAAA